MKTGGGISQVDFAAHRHEELYSGEVSMTE